MSPKPFFAVKPVLTVFLILIMLLFQACADKIKTDVIGYKTLDESLINSNNVIAAESQTMVKSLGNKLTEPSLAGKAVIWYPRAQQIQKYTKDMSIYIEGLRSEIKKEAGLKTNSGIESYKESDKTAVIRVFFKKEKGRELYEHLKQYKQNILAVDPMISEEFRSKLLIIPGTFEPANANEQDFSKTFFDDISAIAASTVLNAFQNNVKIAENRLLNFCHNQVTGYTIADSK
jgi:hypothetical protein